MDAVNLVFILLMALTSAVHRPPDTTDMDLTKDLPTTSYPATTEMDPMKGFPMTSYSVGCMKINLRRGLRSSASMQKPKMDSEECVEFCHINGARYNGVAGGFRCFCFSIWERMGLQQVDGNLCDVSCGSGSNYEAPGCGSSKSNFFLSVRAIVQGF